VGGPEELTSIEAYVKIYTCFKNNRDVFLFDAYVQNTPLSFDPASDKFGPFLRRHLQGTLNLIDHLPTSDTVSEIEMKAVFCEVLLGNLENGFMLSDGAGTGMSHYAREGLRALTGNPTYAGLTASEVVSIVDKDIFPYLRLAKLLPYLVS